MKNLILTILFLGNFLSTYAQDTLVVNGEKYPLNEFKKNYAYNIEQEGYENALKSYVNYLLLLQKAQELQVDTMAYYHNLFGKQNAEIKRNYLDQMIQPMADSLGLVVKELPLNKKIELINKSIVQLNLPLLETDSSALKSVIDAAGEDFLTKKDSLVFKGNSWILKTPTKEFTQQDFVTQLNFAQKNIKEEIKLSDLIKNGGYAVLRDGFIVNDYQEHFGYYNPLYQQEVKLLSESILINYILEKEVYQKYSGEKLQQELSNYLTKHQDRYIWPLRYEAEIIRYYNPNIKKDIINALKKKSTGKEIEKKLNKEDQDVQVVVSKGKFPVSHEVFGENFNPSKKIQEGSFRKTPTIIHLIKKLPPSAMTVEEAYKILKEDFDNNLLNEFFVELRKNADIKIKNEN